MVFFRAGDIKTMLADSPHSITIGNVTEQCIFDDWDEVVLEGEGGAGQVVRATRAQVETTLFPAVKGDDAVRINFDGQSVEYKVWRSLLQGDGAITELYLRKV